MPENVGGFALVQIKLGILGPALVVKGNICPRPLGGGGKGGRVAAPSGTLPESG